MIANARRTGIRSPPIRSSRRWSRANEAIDSASPSTTMISQSGSAWVAALHRAPGSGSWSWKSGSAATAASSIPHWTISPRRLRHQAPRGVSPCAMSAADEWAEIPGISGTSNEGGGGASAGEGTVRAPFMAGPPPKLVHQAQPDPG